VKPISVDIVIIGRNEGELLRLAIVSSQAASDEYAALGNPKPRIIYVDGQSTDGSLQLAESLGVETHVVTGQPNPAAGRHLGFRFCRGKYVFFVDGDMEVQPGWLPRAIAYLEEHPSIAGVAGYVDWEIFQGKKVILMPNYKGIATYGQKVITDVGGGFVYRSAVLREVGDFDPTMTRHGEFEMYLRIIDRGFHLVYLTIPMAIHRDQKGSMGKGFIKKSILTRNVFIPGVIARKATRSAAVLRILMHLYWLYLWHPLSLIMIVLTAWLAVIARKPYLWGMFLVGIVVQLFFAHWIYKKRFVKRALVSLLTINVYIAAFIIGYITQWPDVGGYYKQTAVEGNKSGV